MIYKSNWGKTQENSYKREIFTKKSEKKCQSIGAGYKQKNTTSNFTIKNPAKKVGSKRKKSRTQTSYISPKPNANDKIMSITATVTCKKRIVTFLSNLLPKNAPAMAAKVAHTICKA